jgi:hypothetical protein
VPFFLDEQQINRVDMLTVDPYMLSRQELDESQLFVMLADEYQRAQASQKFVMQPPERIMTYPDGQPGFLFVRMHYADNVDTIFEAERQARAVLREAKVTLDGQQILVRHSLLDIGAVSSVFDGDDYTLMRGMEANPLIVELEFPSPRNISSVGLTMAALDFGVKVIATSTDSAAPREATMEYRNMPVDPHVDILLPGGSQPVSKLRIEITSLTDGELAHIHVREIGLK